MSNKKVSLKTNIEEKKTKTKKEKKTEKKTETKKGKKLQKMKGGDKNENNLLNLMSKAGLQASNAQKVINAHRKKALENSSFYQQPDLQPSYVNQQPGFVNSSVYQQQVLPNSSVYQEKVLQTPYVNQQQPVLQTPYVNQQQPVLQTPYVNQQQVLQPSYVNQQQPVLQTPYVNQQQVLQPSYVNQQQVLQPSYVNQQQFNQTPYVNQQQQVLQTPYLNQQSLKNSKKNTNKNIVYKTTNSYNKDMPFTVYKFQVLMKGNNDIFKFTITSDLLTKTIFINGLMEGFTEKINNTFRNKPFMMSDVKNALDRKLKVSDNDMLYKNTTIEFIFDYTKNDSLSIRIKNGGVNSNNNSNEQIYLNGPDIKETLIKIFQEECCGGKGYLLKNGNKFKNNLNKFYGNNENS
jgi:hypothetical protein